MLDTVTKQRLEFQAIFICFTAHLLQAWVKHHHDVYNIMYHKQDLGEKCEKGESVTAF